MIKSFVCSTPKCNVSGFFIVASESFRLHYQQVTNILQLFCCMYVYTYYICFIKQQDMTHADITTRTNEMIQSVINGGRSDYFTFDFNETEWTIRVSNHHANPERVDENTISFVVVLPEVDDEDCGSWSVSKKSFKSITNQFILDENGEFNEQFTDVEECIEFLIN